MLLLLPTIIPLFTLASIYICIAPMIVGPSKCLKQIIQIELNRVKYPNWLEANQLAISKHGRGFELGTTVNKSSWQAVWDLNSELQVQCLTSRPHCLLMCSSLRYCITNFVDWWMQKQFTSVLLQILVNVKMKK